MLEIKQEHSKLVLDRFVKVIAANLQRERLKAPVRDFVARIVWAKWDTLGYPCARRVIREAL